MNVPQRLAAQAAAVVMLWIPTYLSLFLWFAWLGDTARDGRWYSYGQAWEYAGLAVTVIVLSRSFALMLNRGLVVGTMSLSLIFAFYDSTRGDVTGTSLVGIPVVAVVAPLFIAVALVGSTYRFRLGSEEDDDELEGSAWTSS
ncbi:MULTISPECIES: hypothetical protein [unclassified Arthrobacter]|uniref:hypothetical protein n=1 Tax=unclassified Arthrobacter TaxID=235627 RepID=UPI0014908CA8|nr:MULTISPECIES: hypothetical protein [unclassified Arthrobacter]NOJ63403.1 hypothetical protein [Arthrobacter sp. 147(2020)]